MRIPHILGIEVPDQSSRLPSSHQHPSPGQLLWAGGQLTTRPGQLSVQSGANKGSILWAEGRRGRRGGCLGCPGRVPRPARALVARRRGLPSVALTWEREFLCSVHSLMVARVLTHDASLSPPHPTMKWGVLAELIGLWPG